MEPGAQLDPLDQLVRAGVAVIVATRDGELRPELARAWGPSLSPDRRRLTVCVEAVPDSVMADNLKNGMPVAATLSQLQTHTTIQLKGRAVEVGAPTPVRLQAVAAHVDRFVAEGELVGMPEAFARGLVGHELLDITIEVTQRSDETPGPRTGRPL